MGRLNFLADLFRRNKLVFVFLFISAVAIGGEFFDKINVGNLELNGNTISSTDTNGNVELNPDGTGTIELKADTNVTGDLSASGDFSVSGGATVTGATTFSDDLSVTGNISVSGTVDGRDVSADGAVLDTLNSNLGQITADEANQLENIDTETISNQQWGFLGALDQALTTVSDVVFATLGIGGNPDSSAIFDMTSTTKGSRPCPSMTEAQRDAISNPATGLCVINTDTNKYNYYDGAQWLELGGGSGGGSYFEGDVETAESSIFSLSTAGYASGEWAQMTGNSVTLPPGRHLLDGNCGIRRGGTNHAVTSYYIRWAFANGNNTGTNPDSTSAGTFLPHFQTQHFPADGHWESDYDLPAQPAVVLLTETTDIYLNAAVTFNSAGQGGLFCRIRAVKYQ